MTLERTPIKEPSSTRLTLTLAVAGLVSGLLLVGVYELTLPRIKANESDATQRAVLAVVPGSRTVERLNLRDGQLAAAPASSDSPLFAAYDETGALAGYALLGSGAGFQDKIVLMFGYDPRAQTVTGLEIIDSRETPGLGDKIFKDPKFDAEFDGLAVRPEPKLVKEGQSSRPNEVDAITGATISSRAVVSIVNATIRQWLPLLSGAAHGVEGESGASLHGG